MLSGESPKTLNGYFIHSTIDILHAKPNCPTSEPIKRTDEHLAANDRRTCHVRKYRLTDTLTMYKSERCIARRSTYTATTTRTTMLSHFIARNSFTWPYFFRCTIGTFKYNSNSCTLYIIHLRSYIQTTATTFTTSVSVLPSNFYGVLRGQIGCPKASKNLIVWSWRNSQYM